LIILSCDVKILAVYSFASSQSTRVTDKRTDGQNYDPHMETLNKRVQVQALSEKSAENAIGSYFSAVL